MQDYALLNTCCIFKYERFCNLQCLLHLNFWIYFLKNMVLHMKMCKSLHIAHFEYATLQYIVPHFGSLFCTLWIFQCAKSCTLQCNISKVPILTLYVISRSYFHITSYLQGAKSMILYICTRASIKLLSRPNFFITPYMQGANCKILHICKLASTKFLSRPNFKIFFLHHRLPARCKVQNLEHLHTCKY